MQPGPAARGLRRGRLRRHAAAGAARASGSTRRSPRRPPPMDRRAVAADGRAHVERSLRRVARAVAGRHRDDGHADAARPVSRTPASRGSARCSAATGSSRRSRVLWADPSLARGVLLALAATQATRADPARDAQPGKILHEARGGEMAALGEIPFGRLLRQRGRHAALRAAGRAATTTAPATSTTIRRLWPHIEAALAWIDRDGDRDGDGFVEYARATDRGLREPGLEGLARRDLPRRRHAGRRRRSRSARCRATSMPPSMHAAELAGGAGRRARARAALRDAGRAAARRRSSERFWCDDLGVYALALDGDKRPCRVVSSNAAQCLMSGIAVARARAARRRRR